MLYLILSDIHHARDYLIRLLNKYQNKIEGILFSGDGLDVLKEYAGFLPLYYAKGNMDPGDAPIICENQLGRLKIFMTHGHLFGVKHGLFTLKRKIVLSNYDLIIFGHTHHPYYEKIGNTVLFNPGALQKGEYGTLVFEDDDFYLTHENL